MNKKFVGFIAFALIALSVMGAMVSANQDLQIDYLKIDGEIYEAYNATTEVLEVRRGQDIPIKVRLLALNDVEDVQVSAGIYGYEYSEYEPEKIFDITDSFDLEQDRTRTVELDLEVPVLMETGDHQLRIFVADRNGQAYTISYSLDVEGTEDEDAIRIKEAYLTPSNSVLAGRALSALVKVENIGQDDLDSVTLMVRVPELNIMATETLDEIDADESETFEQIVLRFPSDTPSGDYLVEYTVKFDEFEEVSQTDIVSVTNEGENTPSVEEEKTFITVPNTQTVAVDGSGAVYPVMISNLGKNARSYTLNVQGADIWGTVRIDPSATVIVPPGASTTVFVYVTPNANTQPGDKFFKLTVVSEDEVQDIPLSASVIATGAATNNNGSNGSFDGLKRTLEVGLIILVIILILVGLIVGFNKLRGSDNDGDDEKTYY